MIETVLTCPLGSKCEDVRDNKLHRCAWFTEMKGRNPQTGESVDERACAIAWLPILHIEIAQAARGTGEAVVSMREETIKRQDSFLALAIESRQERLENVDKY